MDNFEEKPIRVDVDEGPIRNWLRAERPREKLLDRGPSALSTAELFAVILRTGSEGDSVLAQARALLEACEGNLRHLAAMGTAELCAIRGIGPAKAAQIHAVLELARRFGEENLEPGTTFRTSYDIYAHFRERLGGERRELFYAVLLDVKNRKLKDILISQGSLTSSIVHPREAFLPAIREAAAGVVFVHNHPSGDPTPSPEDIMLTRRLREVGDLVGVRVLDHIVIGKGRYISFVDDGRW